MANKIKQDISIGENLRNLRNNAHLSQADAAVALQLKGMSISREIISQMERGRYSIRVSELLAMKEIYKVKSFDEFFTGLR